MVEIINEFTVKEETRVQFELAFGPGGAWSQLFSKSEGFHGTTVLKGTKNPLQYLVIEVWHDEVQRDIVLTAREDEYSKLEASFDAWTDSKTELGWFKVFSQATVRPQRRKSHRRGNRRM